MGRTLSDLQSVEDTVCIGDHLFSFLSVTANQSHAIVNEICAIDWSEKRIREKKREERGSIKKREKEKEKEKGERKIEKDVGKRKGGGRGGEKG